MKSLCFLFLGLFCFSGLTGLDAAPGAVGVELKAQNEILFRQLKEERGLSDDQIAAIRKIFDASGYIGQGNPAVTKHPVTPCPMRGETETAGRPIRKFAVREDLRREISRALIRPEDTAAGRRQGLHRSI